MFIATYTCRAKDYCTGEFYSNLIELAGNNPVCIIDNTSSDKSYSHELGELLKEHSNVAVYYLPVDADPARTRFLRSVAESANLCRDEFLKTEEQYMLIVESDVIPPIDITEQFGAIIKDLPDNWGILGACYYDGWHLRSFTGLHTTHHCLSGCTVYKREVIEKIPFRWDENNLAAFSDAYISGDAANAGYTLFNTYDIWCKHLSMPNGSRGY